MTTSRIADPTEFEASPEAFRDQIAAAAIELVNERTLAVWVIVTDDAGDGMAHTSFSIAGFPPAVTSGLDFAAKAIALHLTKPDGPVS